MSIRPTSREALLAVMKTLPARRRFALQLVEKYPLKTARELESLCSDTSLHKRLAELHRAGLVVVDGLKCCSVTRRKALAWRVATKEDPMTNDDRPTSRAQMRQALADCAALLLVAKVEGSTPTPAEVDAVLVSVKAALM